ncbi:apoptosis-associated speck-like protein containing a CARD [Denticeps clupeoides]|uniref:Apoptosis-associated speck-like protein containing a CARD n=1 Tax=Denticeps clupeoides TaxID=299321 RepID=A0AAY4AYR7_9TELE|nr:apoptosis-associated speck-like protein containing a CARD [Denticeps clupeoides]
MSASVRFILIAALENLKKSDRKKFAEKLCESPRISRRDVEDADELDLANVVIKRYTEKEALRTVVQKLQEIGLTDAAEGLRRKDDEMSAKGGQSESTKGDAHFVDLHRTALVERVSTVEPLLDRLLEEKAINDEAYSYVRAQLTSYEKMRTLMDKVRGSVKAKDCMYKALKELEPLMMEELEGVN